MESWQATVRNTVQRLGRTAVGRHLLPALPLVVVCGVIVCRLRAFLALHSMPARGGPGMPFQGSDLTPQHAPWLRSAIEALWQHGTLALWSPTTNAGAPQFAVPDAGVLQLATLLGGVAPAAAAIKWSMIAHVLIGMGGIYALARALGANRGFAALGALAFGLSSPLLDHFRVGQLSFLNPLGLMPWALYTFYRALRAERRALRWALASGALLGLQILEGGTSPVLYCGLSLALALVAVPFDRGVWPALQRTLAAGAVAGAAALVVAGPQLLPMIDYMALTGRAGGLSLQHSLWRMGGYPNAIPPAAWIVLAACGAEALWAAGARRTAVWLAAIVGLGFAAAFSDAVFAVLWHVVPGFRFQRIPDRALLLAVVAGPVLVAVGAQALWRLAGGLRPSFAVLVLALCAWLAVDAWRSAPGTPPMASPQVERETNHAMRWLAAHAGGSRIHVWESPNRHWGSDNVTQPLGLEPLTSYTPSAHRDYLPSDFDPPGHRTFISESYRRPARFWGLLDVRYVLSRVERRRPGFRLVGRVPRCPVSICQPAKSAGPYIYENGRWLPRAYRVPHAVAIVGPPRQAFETALDVLRDDAFDPTRIVLLQIAPGSERPAVDYTIAAAGGDDGLPRWGSPEARRAVRALATAAGAVIPATVGRDGPNRIHIDAPGEGWLVVSEKLALYPGWTARIDGEPVDFFRAQGVIAAFRAPAGARLELSYRPPGLRLGVGLLLIGLAALVAFELLRLRRRRGGGR